MFIAEQKKKENIAEYVLYMWQLQDMLRAGNFDVDLLSSQLVDPLEIDEGAKVQAKQWYANLAKQMKQAGVEEKGHIYELVEIMSELFLLHTTVITTLNDAIYEQIYNAAQPLLQELMRKQNNIHNEVEAGLTFLYGIWMFRVKKKDLSSETKEAVQPISKWMAHLAKLYADMKAGKLDFTKN